LRLADGDDVVAAALDWAKSRVTQEPVLIYATAAPELVKEIQARIGVERAGSLVEEALASIALGLVELGVGQLIVAGGETSGAVVKALGIERPAHRPGDRPRRALDGCHPERSETARTLALALKSGNFGSEDFFLKAWDHLA
jgi:uncharacterized protein YgbK (DUF1537 family)